MTSGPEIFSDEKVAVCIPAYNQAPYLAAAIRSVLAQDHPVDEIIVSDDASTDGTTAVCEQFAREIPFFRYHRQEGNLGIEGNVDFLFRQAASPYIVRLDSDDRLLPGYVTKLMAALRNAPEAAYAHGDIWEMDREGRHTHLRTLYRAPGFQSARDSLISSQWGYRVAGNILLFRHSALERVDYMKGRGNFAEDYHLAVALARAGYGNVYVSEPLAEYRIWVDEQGKRSRRKEQELAGLIRVYAGQIEPGFREAGMPLGSVRKARKRNALRHVIALDYAGDSPEDKGRLESLLIDLGDSRRLRLLIRFSQWRLGFIVRGYWLMVDFSRAIAKKWLRPFLRN